VTSESFCHEKAQKSQKEELFYGWVEFLKPRAVTAVFQALETMFPDPRKLFEGGAPQKTGWTKGSGRLTRHLSFRFRFAVRNL